LSSPANCVAPRVQFTRVYRDEHAVTVSTIKRFQNTRGIRSFAVEPTNKPKIRRFYFTIVRFVDELNFIYIYILSRAHTRLFATLNQRRSNYRVVDSPAPNKVEEKTKITCLPIACVPSFLYRTNFFATLRGAASLVENGVFLCIFISQKKQV